MYIYICIFIYIYIMHRQIDTYDIAAVCLFYFSKPFNNLMKMAFEPSITALQMLILPSWYSRLLRWSRNNMITVSHESDLWMSGGYYSLPFPFNDDIICYEPIMLMDVPWSSWPVLSWHRQTNNMKPQHRGGGTVPSLTNLLDAYSSNQQNIG